MTVEQKFGVLQEPDQNCHYVNRMARELGYVLTGPGVSTLKRWTPKVVSRFTTLRERGNKIKKKQSVASPSLKYDLKEVEAMIKDLLPFISDEGLSRLDYWEQRMISRVIVMREWIDCLTDIIKHVKVSDLK